MIISHRHRFIFVKTRKTAGVHQGEKAACHSDLADDEQVPDATAGAALGVCARAPVRAWPIRERRQAPSITCSWHWW